MLPRKIVLIFLLHQKYLKIRSFEDNMFNIRQVRLNQLRCLKFKCLEFAAIETLLK